MATLTIRNLDDSLVEALKVRAARNNRSLEAEAREILGDAALHAAKMAALRRAALEISAQTPPQKTDSVEILRELREERRR